VVKEEDGKFVVIQNGAVNMDDMEMEEAFTIGMKVVMGVVNPMAYVISDDNLAPLKKNIVAEKSTNDPSGKQD